MLHRFFYLLLVFVCSFGVYAQNLTISSSGDVGPTSGTNWSITGNTLNVAASGSANIHPNVISNHLNSVGNLTVVLPFQSGVARQCSIDATITYTGSATRTLTFLIANDIFITTPNQSITATGSGALNVVLRAANSGGVSPDNGRISIRQNNTINTNGGHLWIGGGSVDVTWNGLTVGNHFARTWSDDVPGLWIENSTLNTNGGNVYLAGLSHNSSANSGVNYGVRMVDSDISSVSGNIEINGELRGRYHVGNGTRIESTTTTATSITTTTGSITISGKGYDADPNDNGNRFGAVITGLSSTIKTIISSTSGNIQIEGNAYFTATVNDKEGLGIGGATEIISRSGNITIRGTNTLETSGHYCNSIRFNPINESNSIRVGFDGTNSYTGNILIEGNSIYQRYLHSSAGSIAVQTTGTLTIQPTGTAFTYMRANDPGGTLTYDNDWNFGTTLSSFTFGKSTNTTNLTFANVLSPAGPITIYGGNININENLNTSAGASSGNVLIKSSADIILAANKSITTSGASVILWANSDNGTANGSIALRNGSSIVTGSNTVSGGHVWLGGGSNGTTWNGLAVGSGYAVPGTSFTPPSGSAADAGIYLEQNSITSFGGNIKISGDAGASGFAAIITYGNTITINAGSGKIEMDGQVISTGPGNRNGILFGLHDKNIFSTVNISSSSTSGDAITITGVGRGTEDAIGLSGTVNITASGGGNIVMNGNALGTGRSIVAGNFYHGILNVFANSGNISLNGNTKAVQVATAIDLTGLTSGPSKINIGQGGSILSSSSNVVLTADNIALAAGGIAVNTSGTVTIQPSSNSFTNAISYPISSLSMSNTISGLTIGKSTNNSNVSFTSNQTIAGPITAYGGQINIGVGVDLTTTTANGHVNFLSSNGFGTVATSGTTRGKIMTTGGGNININADTDNNNTGQLDIDWLTLDGGTGNIVLEGASYSWNTSSSVTLPEFYGTGALTIRNVPGANYSFTTAWIAVFGNFSGLTLGSNSGVEEILVAPCTVCDPSAKNYTGATWQIAGPINIYGSKVTVDLSLKSTLASADILFKSINSILVNASRSVTSNNGDITFWATADGTANSTDGDFIGIQNAVVINSANGLTNQTSGGGTITMAGGTETQTLASGTIVPTGYAYSNRTTNWGPLLPPGGVNFGYSTAANGQVNSLSIYSGGGNIVIKGKSHSSSAGIQWFSGSAGATQIINSGVGTILFDGLATSTNAHGIEFMSYASVVSPTIISSNTSSAAISIKGETYSTNLRSGYQGTVKLEANGIGGGIQVYGIVPSSSNYGAIEAGTLNAYALSGPITFISEGGLGLIAGGTWGKGTLPSSSSNITLRSDKISLYAATIESTGTLTVEPLGTSFASALTFPITNLTVGNTVSGLTLGNSTNTANITFANATTIAGPITAYGGNMFLNDNLTTTGTGTDVLIKGTSNINLAASKTITTAAGDVNLWADSDDNATGYVQLLSSAAINSTGGDINLGGGANLTSDYAFGTTAETCPEVVGTQYISGVHMRLGSSLTSSGGNISLRGQNANTSASAMSFGLSLRGVSMNSGSGKISLNGVASGSGSVNGQGVASWGTLTLRSANTTADAISIIGDASAVNAGVSSLGVNMVALFEATGTGGGITINGKAGTATEVIGVGIGGAVLAASGPITIIGESTNNVQPINFGSGMIIGKKASTNVESSSSNVILEANAITTAGTTIDCSGALTVRSTSTSFPSSFTWPLTNVTHAAGLSGLTIGKSTNTSTITIGTATSINGPITLYGGTLALNNALTTTNTGTGDLSLNGTTLSGASTLTVADGRTLTMNLSSNTNYTGAISGTGLNFVKDGAGTLTLPTPTSLSFAAMTISAGGYKLNPTQQLTLSGALTNNGTFTMKSGASLVQATSGTSISGTGTFNVEKALTDNNPTWSTTSGRFWYMGVPMVSVARSSFGTPGTTTNRVWSYAESTKQYTELTSGSLSAGTGYVHRRTTNDTLSFSAVGANGLYGGDFSLTNLTRTTGTSAGYHLVSNPYMAYLDWNSVTKTNIEPTFYIRTNNTTNSNISALISYNSETNLSTNTSSVTATTAQLRYIAPLQSIWVRVGTAAATGSLGMTRGMLSHQTGNVGLKSSTVFPTLARVNLVDGNNFDQLLVYLNSDMSNEVDQYDSEKMAASGTVQVYTMSSNKKLVMNGLKNNKKKVSVPLYLELPETKSYTLQLSEYMVEDGLILLEDKQEGTIQDFTLMENYSFYANSGLLQNRFVLHFILPDAELTTQGPSNSWVAEEGSYTEGGDVEIFNDDRGNIHITLNQPEDQKVEGTVFVTDMNGKAVYSGQLEGIITAIELDVPSGIYYLTVQSGTLIEKKKVFIQE